MKLRLSELANIADVVAAVGVIVTLIFLTQSIRENTAVTRAGSYEELISDVNSFTSQVVEDPELSRIWRSYQAGDVDELTEDQAFRLNLLLRTVFRNYEKAYYASQYGTLGASEFSRFNEQSCSHFGRMPPYEWPRVREVLTAEFGAYVEAICETQN